MSEKKTESVLVDIYLARAYLESEYTGIVPDSINDGVLNNILSSHGVTREKFDSTLSWYGRNMDLYAELLGKVGKTIEDRQRRASGSSSNEEDLKNDFWPYSRHTMILAGAGTNNFSFSLPMSLQKGESVDWNFRVSSSNDTKVLLGVDYNDGTSSMLTRNLYGDRKVSISLQTDTSRTVRRIFGLYRSQSPLSAPVFIDSVTLRTVPFDSTSYYRISSQRNYWGPRKRIKKSVESETEEMPNVANGPQPLSAPNRHGGERIRLNSGDAPEARPMDFPQELPPPR